MSQVETGEVIDGKYRVDRVLGQGGMGSVVLATHTIRRAPVALKFLLPEIANVPSVVERFINEAVAASALDCDNVISVFDVGDRNGAPYLVMEYLEGHDMEEALEKCGGQMEIGRAVHVVLQALRGLTAAHSKGIVHRDLKPANIFLITKEGETDFVKLLDFGVSKLTSPDRKALTSTGTGLGTPLYMSPEQARNAQGADARADLYSMGAVLYQALAGRVPLDGESMAELITKLITEEPQRLDEVRPDVPKALADIVHHALAKDPNQRYASAYQFASDLSAFADDRSMAVVSRLRATAQHLAATGGLDATMVRTGGSPMAATAQAFGGGKTGQPLSDSKGSNKGLMIAAAAGVLVLGAGAFFALSGGGGATAQEPTETPAVVPAAAPEEAPAPAPAPVPAPKPVATAVAPTPVAEPESAQQPTKSESPASTPPQPAQTRIVSRPKAPPKPKPAAAPAPAPKPKPAPAPAPAPTRRNPLDISIK